MPIPLRPVIAAALTMFLAPPAAAEVIRGTGGPMNFDIGYGIEANKGSTLQREWVIVTDRNLPAKLLDFDFDFDFKYDTYIIDYTIETESDIQAIEIRFIPFNIWGDSETPLSSTDIQDFSVGKHRLSGRWEILSRSDATHHYALLGYVAQVKLATGKILRANTKDVVREAQRFSEDYTSGDLSADE